MTNREVPTRLDALSEMLALSSYGNTKNILMTAAEVRGPFDVDAMALAAQRAATSFPQFTSCIREQRVGARFRLFREYRPDLEYPVIISDVEARRPGLSSFDALVAHLTHRLDRNWDLFHEPPGEYHIVRLAEDHHFCVPVMHHVAADAGTAAELGKKSLEYYHEIVTGRPPDWGCLRRGLSTARKRPVHVNKPSWRDLLANAREAIGHMVERPTLPAGTGNPMDRRQHQVKRVLSLEETEALVKLSAAKGASFVDLMVAGTNIAIDRWNESRNVAPGLLTTSISVNMKGRYRRLDAPNNSALIFFRSSPEERQNAATFARSLALARIKQFRRQMDHKFYRDVELLNSVLRPLPYDMKSRITNFVMSKHQFSMAITLLGVIWPGARNGRPTQETCLTRLADANVTDVHGVGYKLLSNTHLLFIIYVFRNRFNFVLAASASHFTRAEAESFMDLVLEMLREDLGLPTPYL
jgi:hypothetical protein